VRERDHFVPTLLTTGPWRADAMHGGAPSALVGTLISPVVEEDEMVTGVQIDLERPVPLEPLLGTVRRRQVSRRIAHLEVELSTDSSRAVSARALVIGKESVSVAGREEPLLAHPGQLASMDWSPLYADVSPIFVRDAVDHRVVRGGYGVPVPSAAWLRLKVPVIAGQESCGLSQLLAVADFGSPLSQTNALGPGFGLINVDVNVTIFREPVGSWFYLDATGHVGDGGIGLAVTMVSDLEGTLGVITQSQIARKHPGPPAAG
jgi:Thioesterase-like superfamily